MKADSSNAYALAHLGYIYVASNQAEKARALWLQAYPSLFQPSAKVDEDTLWQAMRLAWVLMATGEHKQANHLIEESLEVVKSITPSLNIHEVQACLYAMSGKDDLALVAMQRFFDEGGSPYRLMRSDMLKRFKENPEYQAMAEKRKAELAVQLNRIQEMEANGELAAIPPLPVKK